MDLSSKRSERCINSGRVKKVWTTSKAADVSVTFIGSKECCVRETLHVWTAGRNHIWHPYSKQLNKMHSEKSVKPREIKLKHTNKYELFFSPFSQTLEKILPYSFWFNLLSEEHVRFVLDSKSRASVSNSYHRTFSVRTEDRIFSSLILLHQRSIFTHDVRCSGKSRDFVKLKRWAKETDSLWWLSFFRG